MIMKPVYFKDWIIDWHWGVRIALLLMLLSGLVQLGMFVLTQNYMVGYLGAQPEDIQFGVMATYAGIITVIPVQFRFFRYFDTRGYLLVSTMLAIMLNCICIHCQDINLFLVIRFLQGILTGNVLVFTLLLIFSRLPSERVKTIAPAVFYGAILSNTVVIGLVAGVVVESADWKVTYDYLILFQLLTLMMMLLMLRQSSGHRRYPLYQIDWGGMVLFACGMLALAYTLIYGSRYYWFADPRIRCSTFATVIAALLFLYRQHIVKRPVIHPAVFKSRNFVIGICLLAIYYGSKDSVNLIYNYAGGVLKWSTLQVIILSLCNIAGMVMLLVFAIRLMLVKRITIKVLLVTGFGLMAAFNVWMSFLLTPDLSFTNLLLPVFIQGAASGLLFVPLMIFVLSSAPAYTGATGLVIAAFTRFTSTLNSFAGFYNLQLYFNQYFKEGFLGYLTSDNQNTIVRLNGYRALYASKGFTSDQASGLANAAVWQNLTQQSQLLTNRAVFMVFAIMLFAVAIVMLVIPAIGKTAIYWKRMVMPFKEEQKRELSLPTVYLIKEKV
ncbi:MFS transporter [Mucilaginibacter lappiensis]|uniref:MFS transporter n=1 Tax=Mucilaginibacter lappiensis TaxID=354630 RepID=UPI003D1AA7B0